MLNKEAVSAPRIITKRDFLKLFGATAGVLLGLSGGAQLPVPAPETNGGCEPESLTFQFEEIAGPLVPAFYNTGGFTPHQDVCFDAQNINLASREATYVGEMSFPLREEFTERHGTEFKLKHAFRLDDGGYISFASILPYYDPLRPKVANFLEGWAKEMGLSPQNLSDLKRKGWGVGYETPLGLEE